MTISPTARKLADRYGVSPEVMEEIISDTRSRVTLPPKVAALRSEPTPVIATPVTAAPVAAIPVTAVPDPATPVAAPPVTAPPITAAPITDPVVAEPVVVPPVVIPPVINNPTPAPAAPPVVVMPQPNEERDGISGVTVLLIILLILALIGLIYLWDSQHQPKEASHVAAAVDTNRVDVYDTVHHVVELDTSATPPTRPTHGARHARVRSLDRGIYFTSSAIAAQEHLADLRANGNRKAYIETVNRNGSTFYRLRSGTKPAKKRRHRR